MLSLLIPVYNEEAILAANAEKVHAFLESRGIAHEILVTSNGSTDGTNELGRKLAARYSWFRFFELPERGAGRAFVLGVKEARGEFLVTLDADLSSRLDFILHANDLLNHADMVVGSKTMGSQRRTLLRIFGSQLYIMITQAFFDLTISDYSIGAKAFRREAVLPFLDSLDPWTGFIFELCLHFKNDGKIILQIGVACEDSRASKFSLLHEGFYRFAHLFRWWRRGRQRAAG